MDTFNTEPSETYRRRKAAFEELRSQFFHADPQAPGWQELLAAYDAARDALHDTPEQQYLDEMSNAEREAWQMTMDEEARSRQRMVSMLSFSQEDLQNGDSIDDAIDQGGVSECALPVNLIGNLFGEIPVMVLANMRVLSAAHLAKALRHMADHVESDGVVVYRGTSPLPRMRPDWWVTEMPNGDLRHNAYKLP